MGVMVTREQWQSIEWSATVDVLVDGIVQNVRACPACGALMPDEDSDIPFDGHDVDCWLSEAILAERFAALAAPPQPEVDAAPALKLTAVMCDISGIAAGALDHASYRTVVVKLTGDQCAALKSRNGYESIEHAIVESVE